MANDGQGLLPVVGFFVITNSGGHDCGLVRPTGYALQLLVVDDKYRNGALLLAVPYITSLLPISKRYSFVLSACA